MKKDKGFEESGSVPDESLSDNNILYKELFINLQCGIMVLQSSDDGKTWILNDINPAGMVMDGIFSIDDAKGKAYKIADCADGQDVSEALRSVMVTGKPRIFETYCHDKAGKKTWRENHAYRLRDDEIVMISLDTTGKKNYEGLIRESEIKYRSLVEQVPAIIYTARLDEKRTSVYMSPKISELLRYDPHSMPAEPHIWHKSLHPDDREEVLSEIRRCQSIGEKIDITYRMVRKDGAIIWVHDEALISYDRDKRPYMAEGVITEITKQKEMEIELKLSRDELKKVINSATDIIVSINKSGHVTAWNEAIATKTGFAQKEIMYKNILRDELPIEIGSLTEILRSALKSRKTGIYEHEIKDKTGNEKVFLSRTSLIKGNRNEIEGVVLLGKDISSQKRLYRELRKGMPYISSRETMEELFSVLITLINKDNGKMLILNRGNLPSAPLLPADTQIVSLSNEQENSQDMLDILLEKIDQFNKSNTGSVILLRRIEYISCNFGFNSLMRFLYRINDAIKDKKNYLIIHIGNNVLDPREASIIRQEFLDFPAVGQDKELLDQKKVNLLKFIANKNSQHLQVPYYMIGKEFRLSRITTKRWLDELQLKELIKTEKKGRTKYINITDKGSSMMQD